MSTSDSWQWAENFLQFFMPEHPVYKIAAFSVCSRKGQRHCSDRDGKTVKYLMICLQSRSKQTNVYLHHKNHKTSKS